MPAGALPATKPGRRESGQTVQQSDVDLSPLYNVVLLDDDFHSFAYVVEMLHTLIGCPTSWGFEMAKEVNRTGRVIIDSDTLDRALDLQQKVHAYGADPRIPGCVGSMTAVVEPAI